MEKRKRHYSLSLIKKLVYNGQWLATRVALDNAREQFDFVRKDIEQVVLGLAAEDFYKSMTSHDDHTLWQDVYRPFVTDDKNQAYVKLSIINDQTLVVQFKRK